VHAIVPGAGWDSRQCWVPVPYVDCRAAELLFRHRVIAMLRDEGLLGQERIDLLTSWQDNTGFSVHNSVTVEPEDPAAVARLARYLLRPPLSAERLTFDEKGPEMRYRRRRPSPQGKLTETLDPLESLARVLVHVAEPRLHGARYYGYFTQWFPRDLEWEEIDAFGVIGARRETAGGQGYIHLIRVAPDGSLVLLGSGNLYDATSLNLVDTLSNDIADSKRSAPAFLDSQLRRPGGAQKALEERFTHLQVRTSAGFGSRLRSEPRSRLPFRGSSGHSAGTSMVGGGGVHGTRIRAPPRSTLPSCRLRSRRRRSRPPPDRSRVGPDPPRRRSS
jgi:hypothetical protein